MKHYSILTSFLIVAFSPIFAQLSYDNSTRRYIPPPIQNRKEVVNSTKNYSAKIQCDDLINYVETNGFERDGISSLQLINSSWLKEVKAYSIQNSIIVIAYIKEDELSMSAKKYIFCGIPELNWDNFYNGYYDIGKTFGEKFHKYIIDYECKCN